MAAKGFVTHTPSAALQILDENSDYSWRFKTPMSTPRSKANSFMR